MSDSNLITAYSWAAGLFQQELPSSLTDIQIRAKLVNEINTPLTRGKNQLTEVKMLIVLKGPEIERRLNEIVQISIPYLTEQIDDKLRNNILLRLWTGCMEVPTQFVSLR